MPAPCLHGYELDPPPADDVSELVSAAYAWTSGGIVSTPADLTTFIRAYVGGRLFSRAVQTAQLQFVTGNSEPIGPGTNSAGLGMFRYRTTAAPSTATPATPRATRSSWPPAQTDAPR